MTGRPKIYDEQEVLEKAQQVFWEKGYSATSTDEVLAAMGIGRGSFYLAFEGGKKELFEKAIKQYHRKSFEQFEKMVTESNEPMEMIREFFRRIARSNSHTHRLGCFIGNTIVEMSIVDASLEQEAVSILKELELLFITTIRKAQANGQLKTRVDAEILGRYLITLWNGLNITRRMYPDNAKLKPLIEMQLEILQ
jgi:TetR/AcrR family transcriptional regulator, transcriptional repressor for nem operon